MKTPEEYTKDELMAQKWLNETDIMQFSEMEILLMFARDYHSEKMKEIKNSKPIELSWSNTDRSLFIGQWIQTMKPYSGVPKFTEGMIVKDYGSGFTVAWNLERNPIPDGLTPEHIAGLPDITNICPIKDGFSNKEVCELILIVGKHYYNSLTTLPEEG